MKNKSSIKLSLFMLLSLPVICRSKLDTHASPKPLKQSTLSLLSKFVNGHDSFITSNKDGSYTLKFSHTESPNRYQLNKKALVFTRSKADPTNNVKLFIGDNDKDVILNDSNLITINTRSMNDSKRILTFKLENNYLKLTKDKYDEDNVKKSKTFRVNLNNPFDTIKVKEFGKNDDGNFTIIKSYYDSSSIENKYTLTKEQTSISLVKTYEDSLTKKSDYGYFNGSKLTIIENKNTGEVNTKFVTSDGVTAKMNNIKDQKDTFEVSFIDGHKRTTTYKDNTYTEKIFSPDGSLVEHNIFIELNTE